MPPNVYLLVLLAIEPRYRSIDGVSVTSGGAGRSRGLVPEEEDEEQPAHRHQHHQRLLHAHLLHGASVPFLYISFEKKITTIQFKNEKKLVT